jgi:hypothetical protein
MKLSSKEALLVPENHVVEKLPDVTSLPNMGISVLICSGSRWLQRWCNDHQIRVMVEPRDIINNSRQKATIEQ